MVQGQVVAALREARAAEPGYGLTLVGHSMGAGTAAMLTMMCVRARLCHCSLLKCRSCDRGD